MSAPLRKILLGYPLVAWLVTVSSCLLPTPLQAQIAGDATVGTQVNGQLTNLCGGGICAITGGTAAGGNLFHSFNRFSVPTGGEARFDTGAGIQNIISRVTGGFLSDINGTISVVGASSGANLFLINPNGILFGPNASLNLGGSFIASTANSLVFADGNQFSAATPTSAPLLTISVPIGLQYGSNPGSIQVQGPGNNLGLDPVSFAFVHSQPPPPGTLSVQAGKTLALVGGPVSITGGNLFALGGQIEVGSVGGAGTVSLAPNTSGWSLGYENVGSFGDITLSQAALLNASGPAGGAIQVQGQTVRVMDGSLIVSDTLGSGTGAPVTIRAASALEVSGFDPNNLNTSSIITDANPGATGKGGNLTVEAGTIRVTDGGSIATTTYGAGTAGSLTVKAANVEVRGSADIGFESLSSISTFVLPGATGHGNNLTLQTQNLRVADGGTVSTNTFDAGNAGTLTIQATNISLSGQSPLDEIPSGLYATVRLGATGNGGNLAIATQQLQATGGAGVAANTLGTGNAGTLTLTAADIALTGTSTAGNPSGVFAQVGSNATGRGGNVTITAQNLRLDQGANVSASTSGAGNAGTLTLNTNQISIIGTSDQGKPSGVFAQVGSNATGNGGNVAITTQGLQATGGGTVSVNTFGLGNAGTLAINAQTIDLIGTSTGGIPSGVFAQVRTGAQGNGGSVAVTTQNLRVSEGATVSASTFGGGNAGTLVVKAADIEIWGTSAAGNPSGLSAQVEAGSTGQGNDLRVETDRLRIWNGGQIGTTTFSSGNAGNLTVQAGTVLLDGTAAATRSGLFASAVAGTGDGGNLSVFADSLLIQNGAAIGVSNFQSRNILPPGQGAAGNIQVDVRSLKLDQDGRITADSAGGSRGNITINATEATVLRHGSVISTNAQGSATGGNIFLTTPFLVVPALENSDITANAVSNRGGQVIVNARSLLGIQFQPQLTSQSDITASSALGAEFNGVVQINTPDVDPSRGLVSLPAAMIDPQSQVSAACERVQSNTFLITGRGGLPQDATQALRGGSVWTDLRLSPVGANLSPAAAEKLSVEHSGSGISGRSHPTHPPESISPLVEAQGWFRNEKGQVFLVAGSRSQSTGTSVVQCRR
jgi:filamentous hemagglutinin family protein